MASSVPSAEATHALAPALPTSCIQSPKRSPGRTEKELCADWSSGAVAVPLWSIRVAYWRLLRSADEIRSVPEKSVYVRNRASRSDADVLADILRQSVPQVPDIVEAAWSTLVTLICTGWIPVPPTVNQSTAMVVPARLAAYDAGR
jgi:hypothetical protein